MKIINKSSRIIWQWEYNLLTASDTKAAHTSLPNASADFSVLWSWQNIHEQFWSNQQRPAIAQQPGCTECKCGQPMQVEKERLQHLLLQTLSSNPHFSLSQNSFFPCFRQTLVEHTYDHFPASLDPFLLPHLDAQAIFTWIHLFIYIPHLCQKYAGEVDLETKTLLVEQKQKNKLLHVCFMLHHHFSHCVTFIKVPVW